MKIRKNAQPTTPRLSDAPGDDLDRELARRIAAGHREALEQFVDRHLGYLYQHLQRRLGPGHETLVEDITRATFNVAFRRMRPYARGTARTPMRLWLIRLAGRELAHRRRSIRPHAAAVGSDTAGSGELAELRVAVASLPSRQSAAVAMALFGRMPAEEMAGALGVRQARAMRLLRSGLRRIGRQLALAHAEVS